MIKNKIHIFRPNANLKSLIEEHRNIDGVEGFIDDYAFTAEHGDRSLDSDITERAKHIFLMDMIVNYSKFFAVLGFHRASATTIVDDLWDYLEFENCGEMTSLWNASTESFKASVDSFDFVDPNTFVV